MDTAADIRVLNAAGVSGLAQTKAEVLEQAGYTKVTPGNPSGQVPATTVVWYRSSSDAATAQDVASRLGIATVTQVSNLAAPIVVILH